MDGIEIEYWDSCVFLALLQKEQHRAGEMTYIEKQAHRFDIGAVGLITSAIAVAEIFEARLTEEQAKLFRSMYTRSNFQFIDANQRVCFEASNIRSILQMQPN